MLTKTCRLLIDVFDIVMQTPPYKIPRITRITKKQQKKKNQNGYIYGHTYSVFLYVIYIYIYTEGVVIGNM